MSTLTTHMALSDNDRPPEQTAEQPADRPQPEPQGRSGRKGAGALTSLVVNFGAPLAAYYLIKSHVSSSAVALAWSSAIPVVWTLRTLAVQRRVDPLGVLSIVTFGLGVLISWACGGNTLALNLQDPVVTGLIGLIFLGSVAINRPLHPVILRWMGRNNPHYTDVARRAQHKSSMVVTGVLGLVLVLHAAALTVLALTQSASTFVALQYPVGLPIFGLGIAGMFVYRARLEAREHAAAPAADDK